MTTQTNEQVVAQLYWSIRAIKDAVGLTTRVSIEKKVK